MSSASRSALITSWSVSLSLPTTRSWSPWMRTWTFGLTFWMRLRRSRAMSSVIPALRVTSIWPRPLPIVLGSPALKSLGDSWRLAAFSLSTCRAARARSSLADSTTMRFSRRSYTVCVSLKSNLVLTSRRAWSSALVSSAASNWETTSKDDSATALGKDRVQPDHERRDGQRQAGDRADRHESSDSGRAFVQGFDGRPVVRVGTVVEVVQAGSPRALDELVQHRLAARGQRLGADGRHRGLQVVPRPAELGHDQVERFGRRGGRVLATEVRDDVVQRHCARFITDAGRPVQVRGTPTLN